MATSESVAAIFGRRGNGFQRSAFAGIGVGQRWNPLPRRLLGMRICDSSVKRGICTFRGTFLAQISVFGRRGNAGIAGIAGISGCRAGPAPESSECGTLESEWANAGIGVRRRSPLAAGAEGQPGNGVQRSAFAGIGVGQRWNRSPAGYVPAYQRLWPARERSPAFRIRWNRSGPTLESESGAGVHLPRGLKGNLVTESSVPHSLESEWANAGIGVRRRSPLAAGAEGQPGNGFQRSAFAGIGVGQRWNRSPAGYVPADTSVFGRRGNGFQRSAFAGIGVGQRWNRSGPTLESVAAAVVGNADMRFQRQKGYMYLQGYFFGPNQRLWPARERWNRWNRWNLRLPRWSGAGVQ